jgi:hypothetical protein
MGRKGLDWLVGGLEEARATLGPIKQTILQFILGQLQHRGDELHVE